MSSSFGVLLLAGVAVGNAATEIQTYDNYKVAYQAAQETDRPMLVILNPEEQNGANSVKLEDVEKTAERRDLLKDYVVCVLDTSTEHGKACKELFGTESLPRVVVIDKEQKFQIFRTSQPMYGQLWTQVLTTYRTGEMPPKPAAPATPASIRRTYIQNCPTCRQYR